MSYRKKWACMAAGICLSAALLSGCGGEMAEVLSTLENELAQETGPEIHLETERPETEKNPEEAEAPGTEQGPEETEAPGTEQGPEESQAPLDVDTPSGVTVTDGGTTGNETTAGETFLDENGTYSSMEDVALYLHIYGELPDNFMTKNEARDLGWTGGGLERYAPGMCIGGDRFGNYEGLLPDGTYHECDIDTLGASTRGGERLVWDENGNIYYTADHYQSFELIYEGEE